jgi:hypothetical protein
MSRHPIRPGTDRRTCIHLHRDCVDIIVTGLLILLAVLAMPYLALNLRRLRLGRPWAFTICQAAKEWEARDRAKRLAARAADPAKKATTIRS